MHKHVQAYMIGLNAGAEMKESISPELDKILKVLNGTSTLKVGIELYKYILKTYLISARLMLRLDVLRLTQELALAPLSKKKVIFESFMNGFEKSSTIISPLDVEKAAQFAQN